MIPNSDTSGYSRRVKCFKRPTILPLTLLLCACKDGGEAPTEAASTTTADSTSDASPTSGDECSPGLEGCPCTDNGLCIVGLLCLSDLCVEPPPPMTTGPEDSETSAGEATGESGDEETGATIGCFTNFDCADDEVCFADTCTWAAFLQYEITVTSFIPPSCRDGVGSAEVVYWAYRNNEVAHQSTEAGCPASWPDETFVISGLDVFQLSFWESDEFFDDPFTSLCWQQWEDGVCSEPPAYVFHNYGFDGLTGDGIYSFSFSAYPVAWCGALGCE